MGSYFAKIARALYGVTIGFNMLWAALLMRLIHLLPMSKRKKQGCSLLLTQFAWRCAFLFSPWIQRTCIGNDDDWREIMDLMEECDAKVEKDGGVYKPLFILSNHTSFIDTVLFVAAVPSRVLWRCRTYMASHLYNLPILATLCRCIGHFPVYFKSDAEGVFQVDKTRMEAVEKTVDEHLVGGGWLCFFPEGQMNKTPDVLMPFRYGGIKKAIDMDARMMMFVTCGNTSVWPRKETLGGFPGSVRYTMRLLARDGAKALVAELRARDKPEEKDLADAELLARYSRDEMQSVYDGLKMGLELSGSKVD
mmetsp:Transcript_63510/g.138323  ORF Transcript_63510/g.138323 Transcript_63510/m.138323 type:complete len:307 (+) Transcript_63510:57-977(+)